MLRILPLLLALPTLAMAADAAGAGLSPGTYIQATLALLLIVGLLFGAAWMARKVSGGKLFGQGNLRVVSGVALGPRERIVLVEIGETWLVVGIVPGQIRTLHEMPKGASAPEATSLAHPAPFADWLKSIKQRGSDAS